MPSIYFFYQNNSFPKTVFHYNRERNLGKQIKYVSTTVDLAGSQLTLLWSLFSEFLLGRGQRSKTHFN